MPTRTIKGERYDWVGSYEFREFAVKHAKEFSECKTKILHGPWKGIRGRTPRYNIWARCKK